jgi:pimeloyl-ACP methyl ester carboxylesterase
MSTGSAPATIVLVHGGFVHGSGWRPLYDLLTQDGYHVAVVQNPTLSLPGDAAATRLIIDAQDGPVVLVGHSYGGFVTTNAATGDKNVKALVYVDAYLPAQGDTINSINAQFPGSQLTLDALNFVPSPGGVTDVYIKPALFRGILANDLPASQAAVLAATQRPIAASALAEPSGAPAWISIPSWDVIGTADHAIPPAEQEFMAARAHATVTKIRASHLSMISHPWAVTKVIEAAARHAA